MNNFYVPQFNFPETTPAASFLEYSKTNLCFFAGPWLAQFSPCTALATLWPGLKIASIIDELYGLERQGQHCQTILNSYIKLYQNLTLKDYPLKKIKARNLSSFSTPRCGRTKSIVPTTQESTSGLQSFNF